MHFALLLAVSLAQWSTNGPKNGISTHLTASAGPRPRLYLQAYVTTSGAGIYRSDDGGESWQRKAYPCADICVALAVDPRNPDRVYSADFHYGGFTPEYSSRIESSLVLRPSANSWRAGGCVGRPANTIARSANPA